MPSFTTFFFFFLDAFSSVSTVIWEQRKKHISLFAGEYQFWFWSEDNFSETFSEKGDAKNYKTDWNW